MLGRARLRFPEERHRPGRGHAVVDTEGGVGERRLLGEQPAVELAVDLLALEEGGFTASAAGDHLPLQRATRRAYERRSSSD